jgi:hypothetical protein
MQIKQRKIFLKKAWIGFGKGKKVSIFAAAKNARVLRRD